ncbi:MAG: MFS transporter [Thermoleophilia bacterium]|nr:MFS transporter [Thermoleophilia bacterium]
MDPNAIQQERRFSYGWIVVITSFVLLIGSFGTWLSFGVFLKPLSEEFGWSRAATSGAMSILMGVSGLIGIVMGRFTDRYSTRLVIIIGMLIGTVSYVMLWKMSSLWQLYLCFGVGGGICVGSTYTPVNATISKWFAERRTLALGIALMGITVGPMVLSPVMARVITTDGWRTAYLALAIVVFACALPAAVLLDRPPAAAARTRGPHDAMGRPRDAGWVAWYEGVTLREAFRTAPFWMLMVTGFAISAGYYIVAAHIVPYASDVGMPATRAALVLTVSSVGSIVGKLLAWPMTLRLGQQHALLVLIGGEAAAMFLFIFTKSTWAFYVVAVLFGFSFGAAGPVRMGLAPPLFGLRAIGAILGLATFAWSAGGITGPLLAGYVYDLSRDYDWAFLAGGFLLIVGILAICWLGSHKNGYRSS